MARAPIRAPRWDRRRDNALVSLRSRGTPDERIAQVLCRDLADIARRVDQLRAEGQEVRRRPPAARPPRRRPEHVGPLDASEVEVEVLVALRREGLSIGAVAARLGRAYGPVATADRLSRSA